MQPLIHGLRLILREVSNAVSYPIINITYLVLLVQAQRPSPKLPTNNNNPTTNSWLVPPPNNTASSTSPLSAPSSSSLMIGPTSTFYDSEASLQQQTDSNAQYQQWIDSFTVQQNQQQQHNQSQSLQQQMSTSYQQQQTYSLQGQVQPQFQLAQGQYPPSNSLSQYAESNAGTVTPATFPSRRGAISSHDGAAYHQQQQQPRQMNDPFTGYYPSSHSNSAIHTGTTNTPDPTTGQPMSYQATPDSAYQPQQHPPSQSHLHTPSHSQGSRYPSPQSATGSYTSELLNVASQAHSNPQSSHSSSLSPASNSWTDEVYPPAAGSSNSSLNARTNSTGVPQSTNTNATRNTNAHTNITINTSLGTQSKPPTVSKNSRAQPHTQTPLYTTQSQVRTSPTTDPPGKTPPKRKRAKRSHEVPQQLYTFRGGSDTDSDDDDVAEFDTTGMGGGISVGMGGLGVVSGAGRGGRL